jgi:fructose-1,6-bisphosphatase/inositol monophosphatase family enzyme
VVVVDPLDGSTNAALGLPWCATALCLVRGGVAEVGMVANLRTGERFSAVRGGGATRNGDPIRVSPPVGLGEAIVGVNGVPARHLGWRQYRALGSTALDICSVASGGLDGYVDLDGGMISVWDYLAATLILTEAGGVAAELGGRDLLVLDHEARRDPVVASSAGLLAELIDAAGTGRR